MTLLNQRQIVYNALTACYERVNKLNNTASVREIGIRSEALDHLLTVRESLHTRILEAMEDEYMARKEAYLTPERELSL